MAYPRESRDTWGATREVLLEMYWFEADRVGHRFRAALVERFHVAGDRFDDPKIVIAADVLGRRPGLLKKLVRGFVKQRGRLLIFVGEEIGRPGVVDIDAQGDSDLRLRRLQGLIVLVARAVIDDLVLVRVAVASRLALGEPPREFGVVGQITDKDLLPDGVQLFELLGQ